jgi:hypothetical protein
MESLFGKYFKIKMNINIKNFKLMKILKSYQTFLYHKNHNFYIVSLILLL